MWEIQQKLRKKLKSRLWAKLMSTFTTWPTKTVKQSHFGTRQALTKDAGFEEATQVGTSYAFLRLLLASLPQSKLVSQEVCGHPSAEKRTAKDKGNQAEADKIYH